MKAYLQLLRPHQWLKNLMLLFPPFLGGTLLVGQYSSGQLLWPLVAFCLGSSASYILNDICDVEQDRLHARKKHRPLAAGKVGIHRAVVLAVVFVVVAAACAWWVSAGFLMFLLLYLGISLSYSLWLKDLPLIELFCVVSGFVLRLLAGGEAYGVVISDWLFLSVFLLALFLVSGKRLSELRYEGGETPGHIRPVLTCYPKGFLEGCMLLSGSAVLVTYTMYVISHQSTIWVVPLSCFGLLAFWMRVLSGRGGDPTRALLRDPILFIVGFLWVLLVGWGIYVGS
ncbi:decaprenyl-phosphate phosphoribosyltransferase [Geothermobacter hydrogeniphilus]|uniref:Decaprenyl-phosphate phosphoribosyltransferase n=1 Tax=Geothermobacter hydrogeniphilus TaxID=1969733 RepID=A0A1X0Y217_9BACT|nr:decaprenyl-phosphate phosphoribosyltransferase [Geothermobacter hydrogeniphilus]ORJ59122.1 decaprenyl-phosphate phosphoribosyltransferase [Geothermobacter hydrogeniphilus]